MTKEKALYQVKLILDYLPDEEYNKIPDETIEYIENNMEYSEDIKINPDIPLENQKIDEKAYSFLEKIIKKIENPQSNNKNIVDKSSIDNLSREELIKLLDSYKQENLKISKAKDLINEYKNILANKDEEINEFKKINQDLYINIQKCPKLIRKLFFKNLEKNY